LVRKNFKQVQDLTKRADQEGIVFQGRSLALLMRACNEQACYVKAELQFKEAETDGRIN
jgi:energy-coupling factor transporter ATP-binding protein EcfA2